MPGLVQNLWEGPGKGFEGPDPQIPLLRAHQMPRWQPMRRMRTITFITASGGGGKASFQGKNAAIDSMLSNFAKGEHWKPQG